MNNFQHEKFEFIDSEINENDIDNYSWLKDPKILETKNSQIIDHLKSENNTTTEFFNNDSNKILADQIFNELKARIKLDDESVPVQIDNYFYYDKIEANQNYYSHWRYHSSTPDQKELLLNENQLAIGNFFNLSAYSVSHDHKLLAYSSDKVGNERFTIEVKDLATSEMLDDKIENIMSDIIWSTDNKGFYYVIPDDAWRPYKLKYHELGTDSAQDQELFHEQDDKFWLSIGQSSDHKFLLITPHSKDASEYYYIALDDNNRQMTKFYDRSANHLMSLDHGNNEFYALVNDIGKNFRLIKTVNNDQWQELIPVSKTDYLTCLSLYNGYVAVEVKTNGLKNFRFSQVSDYKWQDIPFNQQSYSASVINTDYDIAKLRYSYSSLNTPTSVMEFNLDNHELKTLKKAEIPSGFDENLYKVERIWAPSTNGVKVPISLVYSKDKFKHDGSNPVYLYGYGSYGFGIDAGFNRNIFSLVDRGFVYAIAHIRGGDELGFDWYEQAKLLNKKHTFEDFIAASEYLIKENYTKANNIVIAGGSAGGLLVGAVVNQRPELYKAVVAHVPFVDCLNTMLDASLPLTTGEYLEWGNPNQPEYYNYIKSYSPYNNIKPQAYPHIFATTSLGDTRVAYWEPAKWVAKLREYNTSDSNILFDINLNAGHGGSSGRFEYLKDKTKEYVFILNYFNN